MKIYLASSWRNPFQPEWVKILREEGHEVYDFRNPPGGKGFAWKAIDPDWETWTAEEYRDHLHHPDAEAGFKVDMEAMDWCDVCLLGLPCGRSAHLELGHCVGAGKRGIILTRDGEEPELMAKMAVICIDIDEVLTILEIWNNL